MQAAPPNPSFQEFNAARRRAKSSKDADSVQSDRMAAQAAPPPPAKPPTVAKGTDDEPDTVNLFLTEWFRVTMLGLIVHDIVAGVSVAFFAARADVLEGVHALAIAAQILELTSLLSLFVSCVEVVIRALLAWYNGLSPARIADSILVAVLAYFGFYRAFVGYRLLSLFRLWRFWEHLSLVTTGLNEELAEANAALEVERKKRDSGDALVSQLKSKLQWESEARTRAEDQIRQYKDENMTLLEMLHVAAEERVGALSLDGIEEEEEEEGEGDGGDEPFLSTTLERQGRDPATAAAGAPAKPKAKLVVGRDGSVLKL